MFWEGQYLWVHFNSNFMINYFNSRLTLQLIVCPVNAKIDTPWKIFYHTDCES